MWLEGILGLVHAGLCLADLASQPPVCHTPGMFASRMAAVSLLATGLVLCASCSRGGDAQDRTSGGLGKTNATTVPVSKPDSGSPEKGDTVLHDESAESPSAGVGGATSDDPVETSGDAQSCAALRQDAEMGAQAIFDEIERQCEANDDCTTVRYTPKCLEGCGGATTVAKSGVDAVSDAVRALNESVCVDFDAAGCVVPPTGCPVTPGFSLACVQQRCEYVWEDEESDPSALVDSGAREEAATDPGGCGGETGCSWVERAALPKPTSRLAATTYGGKLYAFGGAATADASHSAAYAYDPTNDTWQSLSPMPAGAYGIDAHTVDDTLYAFLAYDDTGFVNDVFAYDPASDTWTERSPRPTQRYIFSSAVVEARVFIIGGFGVSDDAPEGDWEYKYDVEIYDIQTDTWSTQAGLPNAIASAASCSIGNLIYVFGGDVNATLVYDTAEGTWTERTPPSLARTDHECVRVGDSFLLIGGRDAAGNQFDAVERYEPESDTWTDLQPLPAPRYWFATGELGGSVYVVGGETFATTGELELDSVLQFTP